MGLEETVQFKIISVDGNRQARHAVPARPGSQSSLCIRQPDACKYVKNVAADEVPELAAQRHFAVKPPNAKRGA